MKSFACLIFMCMAVAALAQKSLTPCCTIISAELPDGIMLVRDNTSGRTYSFKADELDANNLKIGFPVEMKSNRISSIKGASRNYALTQVAPGTPCCSITSIGANPGTPCCSVVSISDKTTGMTYSASVDKNVARQLKTGQLVYRLDPPDGATGAQPPDRIKIANPPDGNSFEPVDGYAMFSIPGGSTATFYSYPIEKGSAMQSVSSTAASGDMQARLAECERRNQQLEQQVAQLQASNQPVDQGYEDVYVNASVASNESLTIKVNGRTVAVFNGSSDIHLGRFLNPGKMNKITFAFSPGATQSSLYLAGKFPGETSNNTLYNFQPKEGQTEGEFEVPYMAKKK